jgi:hypothetical protein
VTLNNAKSRWNYDIYIIFRPCILLKCLPCQPTLCLKNLLYLQRMHLTVTGVYFKIVHYEFLFVNREIKCPCFSFITDIFVKVIFVNAICSS